MDDEQLALVEEGLALLIKRYKGNAKEGDAKRLKACLDAKAALRKVILAAAIKGRIKIIMPVINEQSQKAGWEVTDHNDKVIRYHA